MTRRPATDFECLLEKLRGSGGQDGEFAEALVASVLGKNRENAFRYLRTPYAQRAVFVPQCLRRPPGCRAEERGHEYICRGCGACKIDGINRRARELGYLRVTILKGGSALPRLVEEAHPKAVLGVSCFNEGVLGLLACERAGVPAFCIPLLNSGCSDTDVDMGDVTSALEAVLT
jgi:hypothetical protein